MHIVIFIVELETPKNLVHQLTIQNQLSTCFSGRWEGVRGESSFPREGGGKGTLKQPCANIGRRSNNHTSNVPALKMIKQYCTNVGGVGVPLQNTVSPRSPISSPAIN